MSNDTNSEDEFEVATDSDIDVTVSEIVDALKASNPISMDLYHVLDSDSDYLEMQFGPLGIKLVHEEKAHAVKILNSMDADLHDPIYYEVSGEVAEMILRTAKESEEMNEWTGFARGEYAEALDWDDFVPPQVV